MLSHDFARRRADPETRSNPFALSLSKGKTSAIQALRQAQGERIHLSHFNVIMLSCRALFRIGGQISDHVSAVFGVGDPKNHPA
jgi:hypothetical protein